MTRARDNRRRKFRINSTVGSKKEFRKNKKFKAKHPNLLRAERPLAGAAIRALNHKYR